MFDFKFDWSPSCEIGIDIIDAHHKELFSIARQVEQLLYTSCSEASPTYLLALLCKLREYVTYHFYTEEQYMRKIQYPTLEEHIKDHQKITKSLVTIDLNQLYNSPDNLFKELRATIQELFFIHILVEDAAIAGYAKKLQLI